MNNYYKKEKTTNAWFEFIVSFVIVGLPILLTFPFIDSMGLTDIFWYISASIIFWLYNIASLVLLYEISYSKNYLSRVLFGEEDKIIASFVCFIILTCVSSLGIVFGFYYFDYFQLIKPSGILTLILMILFYNKIDFAESKKEKDNLDYKIQKAIIIPPVIFIYSFFTIGVVNQIYSFKTNIESFEIVEKTISHSDGTMYFLHIAENKNMVFPFKELRTNKNFFETKGEGDRLSIHYKTGLFGIPFLSKYE